MNKKEKQDEGEQKELVQMTASHSSCTAAAEPQPTCGCPGWTSHTLQLAEGQFLGTTRLYFCFFVGKSLMYSPEIHESKGLFWYPGTVIILEYT